MLLRHSQIKNEPIWRRHLGCRGGAGRGEASNFGCPSFYDTVSIVVTVCAYRYQPIRMRVDHTPIRRARNSSSNQDFRRLSSNQDARVARPPITRREPNILRRRRLQWRRDRGLSADGGWCRRPTFGATKTEMASESDGESELHAPKTEGDHPRRRRPARENG